MCNQYENNSIVQTIPFQYPTEESGSVVIDDNIRGLLDFLFYYVLTAKSPRLTLSVLGFAAGYDIGSLYNCDNTGRSISKALGISNFTFAKELQQISSSVQVIPQYNNNR